MKKLALLTVLLCGLAFGQGPSFEVASIKAAPPLNPQAILTGGTLHIGMKVDGARVDIGYGLLFTLIMQSFKLQMHQIQGPDWMMNGPQGWDILATMPSGATPDQVPVMIQNLLKDRFGLRYHMVKQDKDVYALTVGKTPLKLEQVDIPEVKYGDPEEKPAEAPKGAQTINIPGAGQATITQSGGFSMAIRPQASTPGLGTTRVSMGAQTPGGNPLDMKMTMEMEATMPALAQQLSSLLDKPVVDFTELKGGYKVPFEMGMADLMRVAQKLGGMTGMNLGAATAGGPTGQAADPGSTSNLKSAIEKLGFRLESRKAPIDVMVIDKLDKTPSEN